MAECPSDTELASLVARREDDGSAVGPAVAAHASECEICKARVAHLTRLAFEATSYATDEGVEIPSSLRVGHVLPRGTVVGRYHVRELLGAGAMGVVYAAYDPELDRKVALKILRADASSGPHSAELRRRLTQEAKTMARLAHANVVRVYDTGAFEDQIFIAMELVHGTTLRRWMESTERPWRAVLEALVAAGRGLAAAHDAGVVHRDFKPDNVLVAKDGRVLVTDFGLAGDASQPHEEELGDSSGRGASPASRAPSSRLTQTGAALGTPAYMAPDLLSGARADARSDLFSFCVAAYEALYGVRPYDGATLRELIERARSGRAREPIRGGWVPAGVRAALRRGLDPDPRERQASMGALLDAIEGAVKGGARRWVAVASALALVAAGAAVFVALRGTAKALPMPRGARPVVAVFDLAPRKDDDRARWIGTAVADAMRSDLAVGEHVRATPGDATARLAAAGRDDKTLIAAARDRGGADYALTGTCAIGDGLAGLLTLDLALFRVDTGKRIAAWSETVDGGRLLDAAARASERLRSEIGAPPAPPADIAALAAAYPSRLDAAESFARGTAHLRAFESVAARSELVEATGLEPNAPLAHASLAAAYLQLGEQRRGRAEAERAFQLASGLTRELRLSLEGLYRESANQWDRAVEIDRALWTFFPDNLEYGLRLATAELKGAKLKEAGATIDELRKLPPPDGLDPRIDLADADLVSRRGEAGRQLEVARAAEKKATELGRPHLVAQALTQQGIAEDSLAHTDKATELAKRAEAMFHDAGDRVGEAMAWNRVAKYQFFRGDAALATKSLEAGLAITRGVGSDERTATLLSNLAIVRHSERDFAGASALFRESIALHESISASYDTLQARDNLANVELDAGDLAGSLATREQVISMRREFGDTRGLVISLAGLSRTLRARGDDEGSAGACDELRRLDATLTDAEAKSAAQGELAQVALGAGRLDDARRALEAAAGTTSKTEHAGELGLTQAWTACVDAREGKPAADVIQLANDGEALASKDGTAAWEASVAASLARAEVGKAAEANVEAERLQALVDDERAHGAARGEMHARLALGRVVARFDAARGARILRDLATDAKDRGFLGIAAQASKK